MGISLQRELLRSLLSGVACCSSVASFLRAEVVLGAGRSLEVPVAVVEGVAGSEDLCTGV